MSKLDQDTTLQKPQSFAGIPEEFLQSRNVTKYIDCISVMMEYITKYILCMLRTGSAKNACARLSYNQCGRIFSLRKSVREIELWFLGKPSFENQLQSHKTNDDCRELVTVRVTSRGHQSLLMRVGTFRNTLRCGLGQCNFLYLCWHFWNRS